MPTTCERGLGSRPDIGHDAADPVMPGVRHVQAHDVQTGIQELSNYLRRVGGWAKGCYDLRFTHKGYTSRIILAAQLPWGNP